MAALTADTNRVFADHESDINEFPTTATNEIFKGSLVGSSAGNARALVAADKFLGVAVEKVKGGAAAGDVRVHVKSRGLIEASISGLVLTDIGQDVYASSDNDFTLTAAGNSFVGVVHRFIATGKGIVRFNASHAAGAGIAALTDNSGGTASDTLADIEATYTEATVANSIASLAAKINGILKILK